MTIILNRSNREEEEELKQNKKREKEKERKRGRERERHREKEKEAEENRNLIKAKRASVCKECARIALRHVVKKDGLQLGQSR